MVHSKCVVACWQFRMILRKDNMSDKEKIKKIIRILNKHVEDVGDLAWQIRKITEIVSKKNI